MFLFNACELDQVDFENRICDCDKVVNQNNSFQYFYNKQKLLNSFFWIKYNYILRFTLYFAVLGIEPMTFRTIIEHHTIRPNSDCSDVKCLPELLRLQCFAYFAIVMLLCLKFAQNKSNTQHTNHTIRLNKINNNNSKVQLITTLV